MRPILSAIAAVLIILTASAGTCAEKLPSPQGYVSDFAGVIDPADKASLEAYLRELEAKTTAEVAVVTVPELGGFADVEEYAVELFRAWGVGKKGQDNGVLILLSIRERRARIEVGYGLEGAITDGTAGVIIREVMVPYFKAGQYGKGILAGAQAVAERITPSRVQ